MPLLIVLFLTPLLAALLSFLLGKKMKTLVSILSVLPLIILLYGGEQWIDEEVKYSWMPALSIQFYLKMDSLSFLFVCLTAIITPIAIYAGRALPLTNLFYAFVFFLESLLIGFFTAGDLALFTIFWEAMLLPLYFIITLWGGSERATAALKFLIYMIAGSTLMIVAVLALYFVAGADTFDISQLALKIDKGHSLLAAIFLLAFAVKTPLFPFHAWLPDAYDQAPFAGTILLSSLLSKAGIYGILRIGLEIFPDEVEAFSPLLLSLSVVGVLYGGLAAWMQDDFKRLIAYSSFSHVNFVLAGLFVWNDVAHGGAILQALNHGITIAALFLVAGWLQERIGSTSIHQASGLTKFLPTLAWLTLFFVLSSVALPGTNNFIGEVMILFGVFGKNVWLATLLGLSVILSVVYMLKWMQNVYFDRASVQQPTWVDIRGKEMVVAFPLILLILWIGIYPSPILKQVDLATKLEVLK